MELSDFHIPLKGHTQALWVRITNPPNKIKNVANEPNTI